MKLTRSERAKIRYQLYRDSGYSPAEARRLRWKNYIDISNLFIDRKTGQVRKGRSRNTNYKKALKGVNPDHTISKLRAVAERENQSSLVSNHGFLATNPKYRGEYSEAVRSIRSNVRLSDGSRMNNDQAWYFAWFMLVQGVSFKTAKGQLVGNADFEKYIPKRQRNKK